jgi:Zn-dependent peptidase ImmA (M78 family)
MTHLDTSNIIQDILDGLDYANYSIQALVERVARHRGRRIVVQPWPMPDALMYGAWLAGPNSDFVFYEMHTARVHQEHIILHELGHMLLGHATILVDENTDLAQVLRRRPRTMMREAQEREAEALAEAIQRELRKRVRAHRLASRAPTAPLRLA